MRRIGTAVPLAVAVLLGVTAASRAEHQIIRGELFLVKDPTSDPARRRIAVVGKERAPGDGDTIVGDPTDPIGGGAFLEIAANGRMPQSEIYSMPAAGWKRLPANPANPLIGYVYRAPSGNGAVRRVAIKAFATGRFVLKIVVTGRGGPVNVVPPDPGTDGGATLTFNNGDSYCVTFGGESGGRVLNKSTPPPQNEVFRVADSSASPLVEGGCVEVHCPYSGGDTGSCCDGNGGQGCDDRECCHRVSEQEHMCATEWSDACAAIAAAVCSTCGGAEDVCGNGYVEGTEECDPPDGVSCSSSCTMLPPLCSTGTDTCCSEHSSPACTDQACCDIVCEADPRCCWFEWDAACAAAAAALCGSTCPASVCGDFTGDCCDDHGSRGCGETSCCQSVCDLDSSCCDDEWDADCAALASQVCSQCGAPDCPAPGSCFATHGNGGCNKTSCCQDVCSAQPSCCSGSWDSTCVSLAVSSCTPFAGTVEVQVNNTADAIDDYLTWSPTVARIRVKDREVPTAMTVVLTNAAANGTGGRGEVLFESYGEPAVDWPMSWPVDTTATQPNVTLTLVHNGDWTSFVLAGKFGKPSDGANGTKGRDTRIEVHDGTVTGAILATHDVMVRVRKNVGSMTDAERTRFVDALEELHNTKNGYQHLQDMHRVGSAFSGVDEFIHNNPAFLTWHRAMILDLERRLQAIDPTVTVPYWDSDAAVPATLFTATFIGAIDPTACTPISGAKFCELGPNGGRLCDVGTVAECTGPGAPDPCCTAAGVGATCSTCGAGFTCSVAEVCKLELTGRFSEADWELKVGGVDTPITRRRHPFTGTPTNARFSAGNPGPSQTVPSADPIGKNSYLSMRDLLEGRIHNPQHAWVGGVNSFMSVTVIDPAFFLYHTNHDRIWARWQAADPRNRGSSTERAYKPQGAFDPAAGESRMAYLDGTLWPWNNLTSVQAGDCTNVGCGATPIPCCSNDTSRRCAAVAVGSPDCATAFPGGWPDTAPGGAAGFPDPPGGALLGPGSIPTAEDVIDYEGRAFPAAGLGYCYDDTPF